jgi:hypothetical protein
VPAIDMAAVRSWVDAAGVLAERSQREPAGPLGPNGVPDVPDFSIAAVTRQVEAMNRAAAGDARGAEAAVAAMEQYPENTWRGALRRGRRY